MDIHSRKLNFINQVLSLTSERVLEKLEDVLQQEGEDQGQKLSFHDLLGVISEDEARIMEKEIEESCEQIHENDWK